MLSNVEKSPKNLNGERELAVRKASFHLYANWFAKVNLSTARLYSKREEFHSFNGLDRKSMAVRK